MHTACNRMLTDFCTCSLMENIFPMVSMALPTILNSELMTPWLMIPHNAFMDSSMLFCWMCKSAYDEQVTILMILSILLAKDDSILGVVISWYSALYARHLSTDEQITFRKVCVLWIATTGGWSGRIGFGAYETLNELFGSKVEFGFVSAFFDSECFGVEFGG